MRTPGMITCLAGAALCASAFGGAAQDTQDSNSGAPVMTQNAPLAGLADGLLSTAEFQKLVAPVALYPDTVLIQVLIAATAPLDVVKAERLLRDNSETSAADLEQKIKHAAFDPSVEVLAIAFPHLVREMAVHIDWTDAAGTAMLAQSDDVLAAVQVVRAQAIKSGALVSSPDVSVSTDLETSAVVVQPFGGGTQRPGGPGREKAENRLRDGELRSRRRLPTGQIRAPMFRSFQFAGPFSATGVHPAAFPIFGNRFQWTE